MMPTNRSTRLLLPVSPAEPTTIGTPRRRDAISIVSRSSVCHCSGLDEVSAPSGPGPTSHDPESAQIRSGSQLQPLRKLPVLIGAKPRCPFGQTIRNVWSAERPSWIEAGIRRCPRIIADWPDRHGDRRNYRGSGNNVVLHPVARHRTVDGADGKENGHVPKMCCGARGRCLAVTAFSAKAQDGDLAAGHAFAARRLQGLPYGRLRIAATENIRNRAGVP